MLIHEIKNTLMPLLFRLLCYNAETEKHIYSAKLKIP